MTVNAEIKPQNILNFRNSHPNPTIGRLINSDTGIIELIKLFVFKALLNAKTKGRLNISQIVKTDIHQKIEPNIDDVKNLILVFLGKNTISNKKPNTSPTITLYIPATPPNRLVGIEIIENIIK